MHVFRWWQRQEGNVERLLPNISDEQPPTEETTRATATAASPTCTIDREEGSGEETSI
jgi:hypothetical protein